MSAARSAARDRFRVRYGPWGVVTGASSGIGREFAYRLAEKGLSVVLVGRRPQLLDVMARELSQRHAIETRVIAVDLATYEGADTVLSGSSDLDVGLLVAAAGFGTSGPLLSADVRTELEMLDVNCRAVFLHTLGFGRRFAARGRGGIILMGSLVGFGGVPFAANYAATKAYVQSFGEALHVELARSGVDVLSCAPGPVQSGFGSRAGMRIGGAIKPNDIAQRTLHALGRTTTVVPGFVSKFLTYSLRPLPRPLRARVMGQIMRTMTEHVQR